MVNSLWWSDTAIGQYQKYITDEPVRGTFDDLVEFFCEVPNRGMRLRELLDADDSAHSRVRMALESMNLERDARVVLATVPPPPRPFPPPVLAIAVHTAAVPDGIQADHSLLLLGIIPRQVPEVR